MYYQLPMRQYTVFTNADLLTINYQLPMRQYTISILIVDYNFQLVKADSVILPFVVKQFIST